MARMPKKLEEPPMPWEQQPNETDLAYGAFQIFRDMGPTRTLQKVTQKVPSKYPQIKKWSRENKWSDRVRQFVLYLERERMEELKEYRVEMDRRHAKYGRYLQAKAISALQAAEPDLKNGKVGANIELTSVPYWLAKGIKLERDAVGASPLLAEAQGETPDDGLYDWLPPHPTAQQIAEYSSVAIRCAEEPSDAGMADDEGEVETSKAPDLSG